MIRYEVKSTEAQKTNLSTPVVKKFYLKRVVSGHTIGIGQYFLAGKRKYLWIALNHLQARIHHIKFGFIVAVNAPFAIDQL